jgi:hypothetical protein
LTGLLAVTSSAVDQNISENIQKIILLTVSFLGIILCIIWVLNIRSYKQLNSMSLVTVDEVFRQIDEKTEGRLLASYPGVEWRDVIEARNVIAHGYFDIDVE